MGDEDGDITVVGECEGRDFRVCVGTEDVDIAVVRESVGDAESVGFDSGDGDDEDGF